MGSITYALMEYWVGCRRLFELNTMDKMGRKIAKFITIMDENFAEISCIDDRRYEIGKRKIGEAIFWKISANFTEKSNFYLFIGNFGDFLVLDLSPRPNPKQTCVRPWPATGLLAHLLNNRHQIYIYSKTITKQNVKK